jgi:glycosyltransferase involved in cell wall biosynthesis
MKKNLFLITSLFPYGHAETFLETEIHYAADFFENIYILPLNKTTNKRITPKNCSILPFEIKNSWFFLKIFKLLLNNLILIELLTLFNKKNKVGILKTMLVTLNKSIQIEQFIISKLTKKELNNTVIYSYWCDESAMALALLKKKYPMLTTVSRAHGWDLYFETNKYNHLPFKPFISKYTNQIFPISNTGKNYILERWNAKTEPRTVFLGVNSNTLLVPTKNEFILVSCSNTIKLKRVELILYALKQINETHIKWVHFGDGAEFENLKTKALTLPPNIQVVWKGRVDNEEVIHFYKEENPSLFINVSSSEGIPVSIMEAFSFGIPAIATNVGGTHEIVIDNYNGILLKENPTIEEIKSAILKIKHLEAPEYEKMKLNAWNTLNEKFSAEKNYKSFYETVLNLS